MKEIGKTTRGKTGPKADPGETREAILAAAREEFGHRGFEATTMRQVAAAADVDVALVSYYFKNKSGLFSAALELPVNPFEASTAVLAEGIDGAGARILRTLLVVWDNPVSGAPMESMLRSLATHDKFLREFIENQMAAAISGAIEGADRDLRATAFTSQMIGLQLERYVLKVEPLASATHEELVALIAPNLQRYLDG